VATLDRQPFVIGATATELREPAEAFRERFATCRSIVCRNAIEPSFLGTLRSLCSRSAFVPDSVPKLGTREVERPQRAGGAITLVLQRSALLRWLEDASGCGPLGAVEGRVVQARPNARDQLDWHDDLHDPARRLAVTIDLTEAPYQGGLFELRDAGSRALLTTHRHVEPGTMLVFDVAPGLEHRVLPVTSGGPRRVYTGWFFKAER